MDKLIVVGSGISGIMTAWKAIQSGYSVELYSKSPDPRENIPSHIEKESSTFDSRNDQRYITLFEGHPYLELEGYVNKVYPGIANDFKKNVLQGGILASSHNQFCQASQAWLTERSELNEKLIKKSDKEVEQVSKLFLDYTRENRSAMEKWYEILTDVIKQFPQIINNLSLHAKGILRLYDDSEVFQGSLQAHQNEGILLKAYTPQELVHHYPAYQEGVERGFIAGGAIEMYGLAFAVGVLGRTLLDDLEQRGAKFYFKTEVQKIILNEKNEVAGIFLFGHKDFRVAKHYAFHTGAFAGPELFEAISSAQHKLAAVEGYWITIENANELVQAMGGKPNKVHGKKSLAQILDMIDVQSADFYRDFFRKMGIDDSQFEEISPIIDFNNMPIYQNGSVSLGVGSGYIFKGLGQRGKSKKIEFINDADSEKFVLKVMELWLEALHGKEWINKGKLVVHSIGCKRSFTPTDEELDINLRTSFGGICMIHDGGNTGSTTKSSFIADYILEKMRLSSHFAFDYAKLVQIFQDLRHRLARSVNDISLSRWNKLSQQLQEAILKAQS